MYTPAGESEESEDEQGDCLKYCVTIVIIL